MITIKQNTYTRPTECREEVVQAICDAFLNHCIHSTYHPHKNGRCRYPTKYVVGRTHGSTTEFFGFDSTKEETHSHDVGYEIRGCEMRRAFKELINAGYYMFKVYTYGEWLGYEVYHKPHMEGGIRVESFNEEID